VGPIVKPNFWSWILDAERGSHQSEKPKWSWQMRCFTQNVVNAKNALAFPVWWTDLYMPGMSKIPNLSGERELMGCKSPMWTLLMAWYFSRTISRRQVEDSDLSGRGRNRERPSERSRSANPWADGQKQHIRPSFWVSSHNITKPRVQGIW